MDTINPDTKAQPSADVNYIIENAECKYHFADLANLETHIQTRGDRFAAALEIIAPKDYGYDRRHVLPDEVLGYLGTVAGEIAVTLMTHGTDISNRIAIVNYVNGTPYNPRSVLEVQQGGWKHIIDFNYGTLTNFQTPALAIPQECLDEMYPGYDSSFNPTPSLYSLRRDLSTISPIERIQSRNTAIENFKTARISMNDLVILVKSLVSRRPQ